MNTPATICKSLSELTAGDVAGVLSGALDDIVEELFPDALTTGYLDDSSKEVADALVGVPEGKSLDSVVGPLEANAFVSDFYGSYNYLRRNRISKAAAEYSIDNGDASADGVLAIQLAPIGTKVEDEFLIKTLQVNKAVE